MREDLQSHFPSVAETLGMLLLLTSSCATVSSPVEERAPVAVLAFVRPASSAQRQEARDYVEQLERSIATTLKPPSAADLQAYIADGCPEALYAMARYLWPSGYRPGDQLIRLEALADVGLDDPWFVPRFADFPLWALRDPGAEYTSGYNELRGILADNWGPTLKRLADTSSDPSCAAALRAQFGILTVAGHLAEPAASLRVAAAGRQLELALACPTLPESVRLEAQRMATAAREVRTGARPVQAAVVDASGASVLFPAAGEHPQLIILWGFL